MYSDKIKALVRMCSANSYKCQQFSHRVPVLDYFVSLLSK